MKAIILAGGRGRRLLPFTYILPKPLMPIGEKPILEIIIKQLHRYKFNDIIIVGGYLADLIMTYFGDGKKFGVKIEYIIEESPLSTAGAIGIVPNLKEPFLVMNGDILTNINYSSLYKYHTKNGGIMTIAMHRRRIRSEFGVIEYNKSNELTGYREKPIISYMVSMGIYIFNPKVLKYIPKNQPLQMPDLVKILIKKGEKVKGYPFKGYWLDIGRRDDYEKALKDLKKII